MLPSLRVLLLASFLAVGLGSAACASSRASSPSIQAPSRVAIAVPAVPPGHLSRVEVDRVLTTQGPPWVLRRVSSEEVMRNDGKFSGWRLVGVPEEWSGIDLRPGDVVMRVNGLPLETPNEAWEAWKSVAGAAELKITVMRDGATRQVTLPIDGAPSAATANALEHEPGPPRAEAPPRPSISIGDSSDEAEGADGH